MLQTWTGTDGPRVIGGGTTATQPGAEEALVRIAARLPDVVVTDISMPEVSGTELCRLLRERYAETPLRIVAYTALAMREEINAIANAGFDAVEVPVFEDVRSCVLRWGRPEASREPGSAPGLYEFDSEISLRTNVEGNADERARRKLRNLGFHHASLREAKAAYARRKGTPDLDDAAVVAVVDKMLKQRRDSVAQYEAAQRFDLASAERFEMDVLMAYKPAGLSPEQIAAIIDAAVAATGASSPADMGKLMAAVKPQLAGKADMTEVSKLVKSRLGN